MEAGETKCPDIYLEHLGKEMGIVAVANLYHKV